MKSFPLCLLAVALLGAGPRSQVQANDSSTWFQHLQGPLVLAPAWQEHALSALSLSPDGSRLASGSWRRDSASLAEIKLGRRQLDGSFQADVVWKSRWATPWNGKGPRPAFWGHYGRVASLAWAPDSHWLASGGSNGGLTLWNADGNSALPLRDESAPDWSKNPHSPVVALGWRQDDDGLTLLACESNGTLRRWKVGTNGKASELTTLTLTSASGQGGNWVGVASFSPDGHQLAIGDTQGVIAFYDTDLGNRRLSFNNSRFQDSDRGGVVVTALAFSLDGHLIASANHGFVYLNSVDSTAPVLAAVYQNRLLTAAQSGGRVGALAPLPDGTWLARTDEQVFYLNPQQLTAKGNGTETALLGSAPAPFAPIPRFASASQSGTCVEAITAPGSSIEGAGGLRVLY